MCKPHDCGNHRFYGVFSEDKKRAWGLLVTVKDTDNAILHPSQYATDRWLGKPDQPIKAHLMGQLKADQNGKKRYGCPIKMANPLRDGRPSKNHSLTRQ